MKKSLIATMVLFVYPCLADHSWDGLSWECQSHGHGESSCESSPLSEMIRKSTRIVGPQDRGDSDVELTTGRRLLTAEKLVGTTAEINAAKAYLQTKMSQDPGGHINWAKTEFKPTVKAMTYVDDMIKRREGSYRIVKTYDDNDSVGTCVMVSGIASCAFQYHAYFITYAKLSCNKKTADHVFADEKGLLNVWRYTGTSPEFHFYKALSYNDGIYNDGGLSSRTTILNNLVQMSEPYAGQSNGINYRDEIDMCFGSV